MRYARRTTRARDLLLYLARLCGGEVGGRIARAVGLAGSPDSLLRLLRAAQLPKTTRASLIGVDDLALAKRRRYATLLVDLETGRPIELLEGREAGVLAAWLREQPQVRLVSRDRSLAYECAITAEAPQAVQVADRFHLLANASQALDNLIRGRPLRLEAKRLEEEGVGLAPPDPVPLAPEQIKQADLSPTKLLAVQRREAREARWREAHALRQARVSIREIARRLGIERVTVRRLLASSAPPRNRITRAPPPGLCSPSLQPYVPYLQERWQQGCHNFSQLYREIGAQGYASSRSLLAQALRPWKAALPQREQSPLEGRSSLRYLLLRPPEQLGSRECDVLSELLGTDERLGRAYKLLQDFRLVFRQRSVPALDEWLSEALSSGIHTFVGFARGLMLDKAAVDAALTLPYSNGILEGHVNRVKLIKRQGYGRANFDLLRLRVLAA